MEYQAKNFESLLGMEGFSDLLLKDHFQLYNGYVANTNKTSALLAELAKAGDFGPQYAEMRRRFGWEWNGMRLHEYYFGNLGGTGTAPQGGFTASVKEAWGDFDTWKREFTAIGAMRGIGWVILFKDETTGALFNQWVNEHDGGHLSGAKPILVLDVFEHAFIRDYGLKRPDYLASFWNNVNWNEVEKRLA